MLCPLRCQQTNNRRPADQTNNNEYPQFLPPFSLTEVNFTGILDHYITLRNDLAKIGHQVLRF